MVDSSPLIPGTHGRKQGHRVLCCCDSRKAVILINLIALAFSIYLIIISALNGTLRGDIVSIVVYCVSILFHLIVICSAIQFHRCAVIIAIIWQIIKIILVVIFLILNGTSGAFTKLTETAKRVYIISNVIWFGVTFIVLYAEMVYVREVKLGIMSRKYHEREKYSW